MKKARTEKKNISNAEKLNANERKRRERRNQTDEQKAARREADRLRQQARRKRLKESELEKRGSRKRNRMLLLLLNGRKDFYRKTNILLLSARKLFDTQMKVSIIGIVLSGAEKLYLPISVCFAKCCLHIIPTDI